MYKSNYILYLDDYQNQASFKALFRRKFPVLTVGGMAAAKRAINSSPIKIILYNQQVPALPAVDFFTWVKNYNAEIIRILIVSNYFSSPEIIKNNDQDLVHHVLYKPWKTHEMESLITKWWA